MSLVTKIKIFVIINYINNKGLRRLNIRKVRQAYLYSGPPFFSSPNQNQSLPVSPEENAFGIHGIWRGDALQRPQE